MELCVNSMLWCAPWQRWWQSLRPSAPQQTRQGPWSGCRSPGGRRSAHAAAQLFTTAEHWVMLLFSNQELVVMHARFLQNDLHALGILVGQSGLACQLLYCNLQQCKPSGTGCCCPPQDFETQRAMNPKYTYDISRRTSKESAAFCRRSRAWKAPCMPVRSSACSWDTMSGVDPLRSSSQILHRMDQACSEHFTRARVIMQPLHAVSHTGSA